MNLYAAVRRRPDSRPRAILLFLHGVRASEESMYALADAAPEHYLSMVLRAPIVMSPKGFAWFRVEFTADGPILNEEDARASLLSLKQFIAECRASEPGLPIVLVGFSQGAIMSLLTASITPGLVDAALCFGGRFPLEFASDVQLPADSQPRIWIGHGTEDSILSIDYARKAKEMLSRKGFAFSYQEYPAGHEITPEMRSDAYAWLDLQLNANAPQNPVQES